VARLVQLFDFFVGSVKRFGEMMRGDRSVRLSPVLLALLPVACGAPDVQEPANLSAASSSSRVITIALWAGHDEARAGVDSAAPSVIQHGPVTISGPIHLPHPVSGEIVQAYERIATTPQGPRRQLFSQTHGGAGLGRLLDERTDLAARHFTGDVIFPLGKWKKGERRSFVAVEHTVLGPARRRITIMIPEIDYAYRNVLHSMAYILTIEDAAGRMLSCERYVYSPGVGLVAFATDGIGPDGNGCNTCPCPAAQSG
jgi:hypothetical protein